jgi:hypothetical protein
MPICPSPSTLRLISDLLGGIVLLVKSYRLGTIVPTFLDERLFVCKGEVSVPRKKVALGGVRKLNTVAAAKDVRCRGWKVCS